jgi:glutamate dehydrogenase
MRTQLTWLTGPQSTPEIVVPRGGSHSSRVRVQSLGYSHDAYGMTTLSVREFVLGIYRKLHLDPSNVRKLQTGGPDGDLGSNEILLGNEKYTAIVDGSGVLVDPNGIDHEELIWLAKKRVMISQFNPSKLT